MSYHATNSSHVTDHFLSTFNFIALHVFRCMLLEIALNAQSVVLEGTSGVRLTVATGRRRAARRAARSRPYVGPFYGASVYSCSLFIRRSTCGSYHIAIFCLISYRIYRFLLWLYRAITSRSYLPSRRASMPLANIELYC